MYHIQALQAFKDNYIWCLHNQKYALIVDPGDEAVVQAYLAQQNLELIAILITHHHWDHVDGIVALQQKWPQVALYLPLAEHEKIKHHPQHQSYLQQGDLIKIPQLALEFSVIATPGHTLGHLCYFACEKLEMPILFCGDTLFSGGCGRLFEGDAAQMFQSMHLLNQLPGQTQVYCTHEYTVSNLLFAAEVEPNNQIISAHLAQTKTLRAEQRPTLPSTLALEREINPFLRCVVPDAQIQLLQAWHQPDGIALLHFLRSWKNRF